jgi:hypothetical protein
MHSSFFIKLQICGASQNLVNNIPICSDNARCLGGFVLEAILAGYNCLTQWAGCLNMLRLQPDQRTAIHATSEAPPQADEPFGVKAHDRLAA